MGQGSGGRSGAPGSDPQNPGGSQSACTPSLMARGASPQPGPSSSAPCEWLITAANLTGSLRRSDTGLYVEVLGKLKSTIQSNARNDYRLLTAGTSVKDLKT